MQSFEHHIPSVPDIPTAVAITGFGRTVLVITCAILAGSTLLYGALALKERAADRVFHHITFAITMTAAISYFAMSQGLGAALVLVPGTTVYRELYYARYLDWMITTPLLLLDLTLLAGLPAVDTALMLGADTGMILTGLIASLTESTIAKWGFYAISCTFFLFVLYGLLIQGRKSSYLKSDAVGAAYVGITLYTVALWTAYPIVWALSEGTNTLSPDMEVLAYAVLDIAAKAVFGFTLLGIHAGLTEAKVPYPTSWIQSENRILLSE